MTGTGLTRNYEACVDAEGRSDMRISAKLFALAPLVVAAGLTVSFSERGRLEAADQDANRPAAKLEALELARRIDLEINKRLAAAQVKPSPLSEDAEFLRRAYLDVTGAIPPYEKVVAFLDSKEPDKRAKLVDELLASPPYARYMAGIWASKLIPRELASVGHNRTTMVEGLGRWFDDRFQKNQPWNQLVNELLTACGTQQENGAVILFVNPEIDKLTDAVGRLFLGVQLQCAQCHDDRLGRPWKRTDYWGVAAFFSKVKENRIKSDEAAKNGIAVGFTEELKVYKGSKPPKLPPTAKVVPPKFLDGEEPKLDPDAPYRPVFARWLTSADNPFFARSIVNRTWAHFFARGLVHPVDDMHADNPPSHPELLKELTDQFVAHDFDLHYLIRAICASQTYQRTSRGEEPGGKGTKNDAALFARMAIKDLTPRQLANSRNVLLGDKPPRGNGPKPVLYSNLIDEVDPTQSQGGIPDTLRMMNERSVDTLTKEIVDRLGRPPAGAVEENVDKLFLHILSRRPTADESKRLVGYVNGQQKRGYQDIAWALLNSAEFLLNH
jgi:hypothetical protein